MAQQWQTRYVIMKRYANGKHARYNSSSYASEADARAAILRIFGGDPTMYVAASSPRGQYTPNP